MSALYIYIYIYIRKATVRFGSKRFQTDFGSGGSGSGGSCGSCGSVRAVRAVHAVRFGRFMRFGLAVSGALFESSEPPEGAWTQSTTKSSMKWV